MKTINLFVILFFIFLNEIQAEEFFDGVWINVKFSECVQQNRSIFKCLKSYDSPIALSFESSKKNKYTVKETYDLHDSGFNKFQLFCDSNKIFLSKNKNSKVKFVKTDSNTLQYKSNIYKKVLKHSSELNQIDVYLSKLFFCGKYIDLKTKDTIIITDKEFIISTKTSLKYSIGLDFYDINFDYLIFNFNPGRIFENSIYIFAFKDKELKIFSVKLLEGEKYETNELLYQLLKIN